MDSGAILVGARTPGIATYHYPNTPLCTSTFGSRVDVSAWGAGVYTTGYIGDDVNQQYISGFGGTSAATPIVVGAALAIQGIQKARGGDVIWPEHMRELLAAGGTAVSPSLYPGRNIGLQPNIRAIHEWMIADADNDGQANIDEFVGTLSVEQSAVFGVARRMLMQL